MANLWQRMTSFRGNWWWNLPHTPSSDPNPPYEGPIGGSWLSNIWRVVSHGGVTHASVGFYWLVGFFLAVITLLEVWLFNVEGLGSWYIPILLGLSALKFISVVAFFMHLRFDGKLFSYVFVSAMIIGISIFTLLLILFEFAFQTA